MESIYWAALGIGGSTLIGTSFGFLFNRVTQTWNRAVTAFAAGVMLAAAAFGLFTPAMDMARSAGLIAAGTACGALLIRCSGRICTLFSGRPGFLQGHPELLFVLAIALHKFPEGMAGGVALNSMDPSAAMMMVTGISLQNLPEGIVMIPPLLSAGVRRRSAACIAIATGLLNTAGVFAGALWGKMSAGMLPFALALAGGAMLDVIISQMIPQITSPESASKSTLIVLAGFIIMLCVNTLC